MIVRLLLALTWLVRFAPAQASKCLPVEGDRIVARDFAASLPGMEKAPLDAPVAAAPLPGVTRVFRRYELRSLAKRYGLAIEPVADLCFERPMMTLDRAEVLRAMRDALPDASIEIAEVSLYPVPRGRIEFRRQDLRPPALPSSRTPVTWRGNVIYAGDHRFSIWARVVASARIPRVVAADDLKRGEPIDGARLRLETREEFPSARDRAGSIAEVVGRAPLRDVPAGADIRLSQLTAAPDVRRGDAVEVEVRSGATRLLLTARAESAGRKGGTIVLRNMASDKVFRARIVAEGKAILDAGRAYGY